MERNKLLQAAETVIGKLGRIDVAALPVSDYNKAYISRLMPALRYYMEIYADCLLPLRQGAEGTILVDYGGGSGFLSMLAKEAGIGRVIYIDLNPLSVETAKVLKELAGTGPDDILQGDSDALAAWCGATGVKPHLLVATDLIEHVYSLPRFFKDLCGISPQMRMVFTTASTPYNPLVKRRLHTFMQGCETGSLEAPNYRTRRETFIRSHYPHFTEEQVNVWAACTRGLTYDDIIKAIETNTLPAPTDKHNTCDPATGNWTERILPIRAYQTILTPYGYRLTTGKGYYNTHRNNPAARLAAKAINLLIRLTGPLGLRAAPFLFLKIEVES